jgi:membrane protease YdiL (CAAX protease family)
MEEQQRPEWGFTEVALFLGLGVPVFILAFGGAMLGLTVAGLQVKGARLLLSQMIGYLFMLGPLWLIFRRYEVNPLRVLRMGVSGRDAASSFPAGILTAISVLVLAAVLRTPQLETPMEELLADTVSLIAAAVLGTTVAPFFEELLFRGLLQPAMVRQTGVWPGIVLSAAPFALLHAPQYGWSWRHVLIITVAGSAFGWRRYKTGSTGAAWVMHAAYNLLLFAGYIAGKWSGSDLTRSI